MRVLFDLAITLSLASAYHVRPFLPYSKMAVRYQYSKPFDFLLASTSTEVADSQLETFSSGADLIQLAKSLPVHIYVDGEIRTFLNMKNSERKGRILLPQTTADITIKMLRDYIEKKFPSLLGQPYILRYQVPGEKIPAKQFTDDEESLSVIKRAAETVPSMCLYADGTPGFFPPPKESYLQNMADPSESLGFTMLSFYRFSEITDPDDMALKLLQLWKPFKSYGRVYVAKEGVNAQMAVPQNVLKNFQAACETLPLFKDLYLNTDHYMSAKEFQDSLPFKALHVRVRDQIVADGFDTPLDWQKSGREMDPKEWHKELENPKSIILDCRNSYESDVGIFEGAKPLSTTFFRESWDALDETLKGVPKDAPLMTYCTGGIRCVKINAYLEQVLGFSNVSRLAGGIISYTRELEKEKELEIKGGRERGEEKRALDDVNSGADSSNDEIFCSSKNMEVVADPDFTMISKSVKTEDKITDIENNSMENANSVQSDRLTESETRGETKASEKEIHLTRNVLGSKFKGVNYVFDERMGARITEDILSLCETCGTQSDRFTNCNNYGCHVRFIQCVGCVDTYKSCCSKWCECEQDKRTIENSRKKSESPVQVPRIKKTIEEKNIQKNNNQQMFLRKKKVISRDSESEVIIENRKEEKLVGISENKNDFELVMITEMKSEIDFSAEIQISDDKEDEIIGETGSINASESQIDSVDIHFEIPAPVNHGNSEISVDSESPIASTANVEGSEDYKLAVEVDKRAAALAQYCETHSSIEPPLLAALRAHTESAYPPMAARMISGPLQGRILSMLASITHTQSVLELGTFTGYSAICLAEGIQKGKKTENELISRDIAPGNFKINDVEKVVKVLNEVSDEKTAVQSGRNISELDEREVASNNLNTRAIIKDKKRQLIIDKLTLKKKEIELNKSNKLNILNIEDSIGNKLNNVIDTVTSEKRERRGSVVTCEIDSTAALMAQQYFDKSDYKDEIELHIMRATDVIEKMKKEQRKFDMVFIDADKKMYEQYLRSLLGSNKTEIKKVKESNVYKSENIIVHTEDKKETSDLKDNQGKVSSISSDDNSGDEINIENEISIENEVESESEAENENEDFCLLNDEALILVDNTLWKGLVLGQTTEFQDSSPPPALYGNEKRMTALAQSLHNFNKWTSSHPDLESVILPFRDGLSIFKYNAPKK